MYSIAILYVVSHVPQFGDSCEFNCCHPPHGPTTSQVAYLRNSGGIEYDIRELKEEALDFSIVFRKRYDISTFAVHVGCGGCASGLSPNFEEPRELPLDLPDVYHAVKFEPFTQHAYYELLPEGESRRFNTSMLSNCSSHHASVRLVVNENATEDIIYGVVVGCAGGECERFTVPELLSLPVYILRTHGPAWNDKRWTIVFISLLLPLVLGGVITLWFGGYRVFYVPLSLTMSTFSLRCFFYSLACYAISVDLVETFAHFVVGSYDAPVNGDDGYTIFMGLYALKIVFFLAVALPWAQAREVPFEALRQGNLRWYQCGPVNSSGSGRGPCSLFCARGFWSIVDMAIATLALFAGAGFYVYPCAAFAAGLLRFMEWVLGRRIPNIEVAIPEDKPAGIGLKGLDSAETSAAQLPILSFVMDR
tara:strand:+ start:249 stop:1508 length:1260 start_codon:yes stop_codon:yes gene_type:complete